MNPVNLLEKRDGLQVKEDGRSKDSKRNPVKPGDRSKDSRFYLQSR